MAITKKSFGVTPAGVSTMLYTMTNKSGAAVSVTDYGAILVSILVPDKAGHLDDVAMGFDTVEGYAATRHGSMGDLVGRCGNRIALGRFTLDGQEYQLPINNGRNHLHGGPDNFATKMWTATVCEENGKDSVSFHYMSPDGEMGYPGNLDVKVTYSWNDACDLAIRYEATTDKATLCNLTNHAYFNLAGQNHGTIRDHVIYIDADVVSEIDDELIPTGNYMAVSQTPLDLREGLLVGDGLDRMNDCLAMQYAKGYDQNYILRKGSAMGLAACAHHEESGRTMEVLSDLPAIQLYTANTLHLEGGKGGMTYEPYSGFCLETQVCPDSIHHPNLPGSQILRPGEKYDTTTIYCFRVDE